MAEHNFGPSCVPVRLSSKEKAEFISWVGEKRARQKAGPGFLPLFPKLLFSRQ